VHIRIAPHDGVPIYLQIVNQVKYLVASGRLVAGTELPPIRSDFSGPVNLPNSCVSLALSRLLSGYPSLGV